MLVKAEGVVSAAQRGLQLRPLGGLVGEPTARPHSVTTRDNIEELASCDVDDLSLDPPGLIVGRGFASTKKAS